MQAGAVLRGDHEGPFLPSDVGPITEALSGPWVGLSHTELVQSDNVKVRVPFVQKVDELVDGSLLETAPQFQQVVVTRSIQPLTGTTPFARFGNSLVLAVTFLMLLLGLFGTYYRRGEGG